MLSSFVLAMREGLEAALIIGIVLGVLKKTGKQELNRPVWIGVVVAIFTSVLVALTLNWIGAEFEGKGEQLFEGATMFLAAGILTWMIFWMRKQASTLETKLEIKVNKASIENGKGPMFFLAFLAVVREGIELALFLLAARITSNPAQTILGAISGLASAAILGWVIFTTSKKISLQRFFQASNLLLAFFAAGLVGIGIHEFIELGWIPAGVNPLWDLSGFIQNNSILGQLLRALIGYESNPSMSQVIAYSLYFVVLIALSLFIQKVRRKNHIVKIDQSV